MDDREKKLDAIWNAVRDAADEGTMTGKQIFRSGLKYGNGIMRFNIGDMEYMVRVEACWKTYPRDGSDV